MIAEISMCDLVDTETSSNNEVRSSENKTSSYIFSWQSALVGIIPDDDGEELGRQQAMQNQILTEVREFGEETETSGYGGE